MQLAKNGIPVIDLRLLNRGNPRQKNEEIKAVVHGFRNFGIIYVSNHGIHPEAKQNFFREFHKYAQLPEDVKASHKFGTFCQRGWTQLMTEISVIGKGVPNKYGWYFANPVPATDPELQAKWPELYQPNYWPPGMEMRFGGNYMAYGRELNEMCLPLLGACEAHYQIPFQFMATQGAHVSRALQYYPLTPEEASTGQEVWGEVHGDFDPMTALGGNVWIGPDGQIHFEGPDPNAGLWLRSRQGDWINGNPPAGCIPVQCGFPMEIFTGGDMQATVHVIKPTRFAGWIRLSLAHFLHFCAESMMWTPKNTVPIYGPPRKYGSFYEVILHQIGLTGLTDQQMLERLQSKDQIAVQAVMEEGITGSRAIIDRLGFPYELLRQRIAA